MKTTLLTAIVLLKFCLAYSQECIDPDLINTDVICFDNYDPVCGCDGVTYHNACVATYENGISEYVSGTCPFNFCINLGNFEFGDCDDFLGYGNVDGECTEIYGCSPVVNGFDLSPYFYESEFYCESNCYSSDGCSVPSVIVITTYDLYEPVCGCDGESYENWFLAVIAGNADWTEGACVFQCIDPSLITGATLPAYIPVCGCNGVTYNNQWNARWLDGVTSWIPGECNDEDNDGIPDLLDCAPFEEFVGPGFPCDDEDETTYDDVYNDCCECEGTPTIGSFICDADIDGDGSVDSLDLLLFLAAYGAACD